MSQNDNDVHYNFGYNELVNLSFEKEAQFARDQAELNARGITTARITAFQGLRTTFLNVPQDGTMVANITIAKNSRDAAAEPLRIGIREVQGIAANKL